MQDRVTHWAVVLLGATLLGLSVWFMGFTQPTPAGTATRRLPARPFRPAGTVRPVAVANRPTVPASHQQPSAPRNAASPVQLPSAGVAPAVVGDSTVPAAPQAALERLPDVTVEPSDSTDSSTDELSESELADAPSLAAPFERLPPTSDEASWPEDAPAPESVPSDDTAPTSAGDSSALLPTEPALIAPGISGQFDAKRIPAPAGIELPPAAANARSQGRIATAVAQRADQEIRRGLGLAQRRAFFSGRSAIIEALRLIAEAQDAAQGSVAHSQALAAGLRALEESDDFIAKNGDLEADLDVASIASGHRTPVLRELGAEHLAPLATRRAYYTFAQEQLAVAVDHEPVGSMALFALGKLHTVLAEQQAVIVPGAESKALVFHQAAMLVSPQNPLAANELAVLLARGGRFEEAREWLIHSARLSPLAATWHNLAVVHRQLGEARLAEAASHESRVANRGQPVASGSQRRPEVQWVDSKTFASQGGDLNDNGPAAPASTAQTRPRESADSQQSAAPAGRSRK